MRHKLLARISRPVWFTLAALFLLEAWIWDNVGGLLKRLVALIPFATLKRMLADFVEMLPAPLVLIVFLLPLGVIEPFKILGLWLIFRDQVILGVLAFVAAKVLGLGVLAFLFDATRDKLLSMRWFARLYTWVLKIRTIAHDFLEPYKQRIHAAFAPYKQKFKAMLASFESRGGFGRRLALLRARARRLRGLT